MAYYLTTHVVSGLGRIDDLLEYFGGHLVRHLFAQHAGRFAAVVVSEFAVGQQFALAPPVSSIGVHFGQTR